ncbi:MAG TPA: exodeoxyribonuclease VII large subunit [Acidimicrobiia bacterium]|nr:exodeoxyribonuclease VII large subunit [Acidimicrobiia bacterium]
MNGGSDEPTFSVGELNLAISEAMVEAFPRQVWVRGEIQQYHASRNQHVYFELVEKDGNRDRVRAALRVALFRNDRPAVNRALKEVPGVKLTDGVEVRIRGRVDFYPPTGRLQLVMNGIDPVFTVGRLAADRERVLKLMAAEGLLRRNADHDPGPVPLRVGLVTSGGSAAYHDFLQELTASGYAFRVAHVDVRVQGGGASRRIAYALRRLGQLDLDVVVVVRGGGARSDLAPFDSEVVARAIAELPHAVFTGIGHEVDRTVADEVAHTCCKTPTAAAGLLVGRVDEFCARLSRLSHRISVRARSGCAMAARDLDRVTTRIARGAPAAVRRESTRVDGRARRAAELGRRATRDAARTLDTRARRTAELGRRATRDAARLLAAHERVLVAGATRGTRAADARLTLAGARLRALDPQRVLERGYTIARDADGRVLTRVDGLAPGSTLSVEFADGTATTRVDRVEPTPDPHQERGSSP